MNSVLNRQENSINRLQILAGIFFLLIGSLVYFIDRPPEYTYFIYRFHFLSSLHDRFPDLFGSLGNYLPDFIHPLSFILITAGIICRTKRGYLTACSIWCLTDCIFELGQKYSSLFIKVIPDSFSELPFLEAFENYFKKGTFDIWDIAAVFAGTATAYFILVLTMKKNK